MDPLLQKTPSTDLNHPIAVDPSLLDIYRNFRGQIEHEDNLVGSRISWFVTSQSFLFSAYAIIATGIQSTAAQAVLDAKHVLLVIIPSMAIVASILIFMSILSGVTAIKELRNAYTRLVPLHPLLPSIQPGRTIRLVGMASPVLLPPLFMAVWLFLLLRRLF